MLRHNWVGQEPSERGETRVFCKYCSFMYTSMSDSHYCPVWGEVSNGTAGGTAEKTLYRTSAWVCDGGCGVDIRHNSENNTYSYVTDLPDRKGELWIVKLGTPSQTVLNSLKYETVWE